MKLIIFFLILLFMIFGNIFEYNCLSAREAALMDTYSIVDNNNSVYNNFLILGKSKIIIGDFNVSYDYFDFIKYYSFSLLYIDKFAVGFYYINNKNC